MSPRDLATGIVRRLQSAGHSAFFVGGCVRDLLLGREPQDYDVATSAKPPEVEALFSRTIPVGRQFGVLLVVEHGIEFEVATFRAETDYRDGRHPRRVTFADAEADARRRDFTVNGLFFDPLTQKTYDWVGGEADLRARVIRTIGNPDERFGEDHLRLLRAVRFAAQLQFEIEADTLAAVRRNAAKMLRVSAERIRDELLKLFQPPHAARGLDLLRDGGLLDHVLPEVAATIACEQSPDFHPEGSVYNHIRLMFELLPSASDALLPWAALLHDIGKPPTAFTKPETGTIHFYGHEKVGADMTQEILERLRFPRKEIETVATCVRNHMQFKDVTRMRKSTLRRLLMRRTFPLELELHKLDCLGSHRRLDHYEFLLKAADELKQRPEILPPLVKGNDLIAIGARPGPSLGALLAEIREKQLQDELTTRADALEWAQQQIKGASG